MQVTVAKTAGFCFGVKRAVDTVMSEADSSGQKIYTYGPIIHNSHVVAELEEKGVKVIESREELDKLKDCTVVIRSHGVSREVIDSLDRPGIRLVDLTCPFVAKIHRIVYEASKSGSVILVAGNPVHPEVQGIVGWTVGECHVVSSVEQLKEFFDNFYEKNSGQDCLADKKQICMVAQTTFNYEVFKEFVEIIKIMHYNVNVVDTVCNATRERQAEARSIAQKVDAMIVIGDRHSSNSQKLYEICQQACKNTRFIEKLVDLEPVNFQSLCRVGITAGASTPKNIIEEVQNHVRNEFWTNAG